MSIAHFHEPVRNNCETLELTFHKNDLEYPNHYVGKKGCPGLSYS